MVDWDPNDYRIFVGDLGNEVNDDILYKAFSHYGSIKKAKMVKNKITGKNKGALCGLWRSLTRARRKQSGKVHTMQTVCPPISVPFVYPAAAAGMFSNVSNTVVG